MNNTHNRMAEMIEDRITQPEPEPVAWMHSITGSLFDICPQDADEGEFIPLYIAPPQRKPLTITEAAKLWEESHCALPRYHTFRLLIEAAHGIGEEL